MSETRVCSTCNEPVDAHTLFGRELNGPNAEDAWHRYCGRDVAPSGNPVR